MAAYRIVFRGALARSQDPMFETMSLERDGDEYVLVGDVVDPAQLHGLLDRIQELGLELVAAEPASDS